VLLLNATLSVREGLSNSHATLGWQIFTDRVVELLAQREEPMVFLLWGRNAQRKAGFVGPPHLVLQSAHPSPLSASRGFFGNGHFIKTNEFLEKEYGKGIDWQIYE
jgi:uracil-DNA glycosylase